MTVRGRRAVCLPAGKNNPPGGFCPGGDCAIMPMEIPGLEGSQTGAVPTRRKKKGRYAYTIAHPAGKGKEKMLMNRKKWIALLLAAVMVLSLAACGGTASPSRETQEQQTAAAPEAPAREARDSVVIAIATEMDTLDPTRGWGHGNAPLLQSTLIRYTADMTFENDLATGYTLSEDGLAYTFTLRRDAYFTDGEQVTADDVVFTLNKCIADQTSADLAYAEKAEKVDDFTVTVTLKSPVSFFLNTIASIGIVPEHAYDPETYGTNPAVSSGPYKFVEWKQQEQLILEANENYYDGAPAIKHVTIVFMGEDAALAAVKAGQVDAACSAATLAATQVEGYHVEAVPSADNRGFTLPMLPDEGKTTESGYPYGNNVTCNLEIRQAIAYCIDRELVAEVALNGYGRPAYSENDGMPWNNPEGAIDTDVEYAKQLLADNGWVDTDGDGIVEKDGLKAEFTVLYPSGDSVRQAIGMAAAEQAKAIGIHIIIEGTSWDDLARRMFSCGVVMGWGAATPSETYYLYRSQGALLDDYYNPEGYMSEITDGYMESALQAKTVEEAYAYWQKVQWDGETGTSMRGQCPWVWIVNLDHIYFLRDGLSIGEQPIHPHGHSIPLIQNLQNWTWEE